MKKLTVKQVSRISGVSVRALHHYDEIGLLKPASVGENRYRYYGEEELLRLQQILIHRELGIPLGGIAAILDAPGFDRLKALKSQRERLPAKLQELVTAAQNAAVPDADAIVAQPDGMKTIVAALLTRMY